MSEKKSIPDLVLATVRLHAAKAEMDLIRVKDELDRTTVASARSRVLRGLRDQLTAQRDAWECLVAAAGSVQDVDEAPPAPKAMCTICAHDPHGSGGCDGDGFGCGCDGAGQSLVHIPRHEFFGCNGSWELGSDGVTRKCADCKELMDDVGNPRSEECANCGHVHTKGWYCAAGGAGKAPCSCYRNVVPA